ncbi:MAG TPA: hypothetical protein DCQ50_18465, partial [Chryseobacterium sp.]|nr:hypothetical protein [Chryseobacterium sp.]
QEMDKVYFAIYSYWAKATETAPSENGCGFRRHTRSIVFILYYLKGNNIQQRHAAIYGMVQSQCHT